ncbi:MAG: hypothetical protein COB30_001570 [Ectothiorhodospiraceae bacterium]|nr:hypothetical protein [Ectothiorhodospiraceae bacterium]
MPVATPLKATNEPIPKQIKLTTPKLPMTTNNIFIEIKIDIDIDIDSDSDSDSDSEKFLVI